MAIITSITPMTEWTFREFLRSSDLNSQIVGKMNVLIQNQELINTDINNLLQGAAGGAQQAKIPFAIAAAPTGWTRDTSFSSDTILRITDGVTIPTGASPTADAGSQGGSWTITGVATSPAGGHQHGMTHTHTMSHTHTATSAHQHDNTHSHSMSDHSHGINSDSASTNTASSNTMNISGLSLTYGLTIHSHTVGSHNHGGSTTGISSSSIGTASPAPADATPTTGDSSTASTDASTVSTGLVADHVHTFTADATWRPLYINVLMCKRD